MNKAEEIVSAPSPPSMPQSGGDAIVEPQALSNENLIEPNLSQASIGSDTTPLLSNSGSDSTTGFFGCKTLKWAVGINCNNPESWCNGKTVLNSDFNLSHTKTYKVGSALKFTPWWSFPLCSLLPTSSDKTASSSFPSSITGAFKSGGIKCSVEF
jgi:hypothetical protein